ncbi:MAG: DUF4869 domain-containing protein [Lachnospiraceae bacterium]|nr:DUF4869 domain-containing protein [Lachnospiraceae bacterium]
MLTLYIGTHSSATTDYIPYFDFGYEEEWFNDPLVKKMVLDIDQTKVLSPRTFESLPLGCQITAQELSGGVKACILLLKTDKFIIDGAMFGENCLNSLVEIGKIKDIFVPVTYAMDFNRITIPFEICIANDNSIVTNIKELFDKFFIYVSNLYKENSNERET